MTWIVPDDESSQALCVPQSRSSDESGNGPVFRFAAEHADQPLELFLDLRAEPEGMADVSPALESPDEPGALLTSVDSPCPNVRRFRLTVPPAPQPEGGTHKDDELRFTIRAGTGAWAPCRVVLRRTAWPIQTSLLEWLRPQCEAALRWYGWNRYERLVGLKRFTSGLSGSDVFVFQPSLRTSARPASSPFPVPAVGAQAWGSFLLVKTGEQQKTRDEWKNYCDFVVDRAHPFLARYEAYVAAQPAALPGEGPVQTTIIGSFLGGDLLQVESLKDLVRGPEGVERCILVLEKLFTLLAPWYAGNQFTPLGKWEKVFQAGGDRGILLFGKYDWSREEGSGGRLGRKEFTGPLSWDVAFIQEGHLSDYLLGQPAAADGRKPERPGLLHRLRDDVWARFSLTHGDLHPENVLADQDNVWLLDFGETGAGAPTLYDFTKLEVYLRLWCLDLSPAAKDVDQGVAKFEGGLLDVLLGTRGTPEAMDEVASMMGASPPVLRKVTACITWLRRRAAPFSLGSPDRRDYLAVLYLTVLQTLQHARKERDKLPNYRMLVTLACLVEGVLSRLLGMEKFPRGRETLDYKYLVTPEWLEAPGAPARIAYLMRRRDGRKALPFLAATRGVLQNPFHHLDVFDHTLLVMANLEELLRDPVDALCRPREYERRVARGLRKRGLPSGATRSRPMDTDPPCLEGLESHLAAIRAYLDGCLDQRSRLLLKWLCLLHDVGKPATRCLQTIRDGLKKVQFRGHESYSAFLTEKHLEHWFPDQAVRERLLRLIENHHQHHHFMDTYLGKSPQGKNLFDELRRGVVQGEERGQLLCIYHCLDPERSAEYVPDLPLLILHGFADVAGCAGPKARDGLGRVAELDLVLLTACVRFVLYQQNQRIEQQVGRVLRGLGFPTGEKYGQLKKRLTGWVRERSALTEQPCGTEPSDEAVLEEGRRIAATLGHGGA
jgi:hypothetical protein